VAAQKRLHGVTSLKTVDEFLMFIAVRTSDLRRRRRRRILMARSLTFSRR
jgi:hypothetical protein